MRHGGSVRQSQERSLIRTIRIPVHMVERSTNWSVYQTAFRTWTRTFQKKIAEEMDIPVEKSSWDLKDLSEPVSLETPIGEEEDSHLGDFIQDENVPVPADAAAFTLAVRWSTWNTDRERTESLKITFWIGWQQSKNSGRSWKNLTLQRTWSVRSKQKHCVS